MVLATSGRDKGGYYLVLGSEKGRVLIADGRRRKLSAPKKKNPIHLFTTDTIIPLGEVTGDKKLKALLSGYNLGEVQPQQSTKRGGISECQSRT
ncbi:MAG: KOW domain-containing RNA-binding protein [Angelakisella sp.]